MANARRWFDNSQPQTLQGAVMLSYLVAAFGLLSLLGAYGGLEVVPLGLGVAAYGVANEKRWGFWLGVVLAALTVLSDVSLLYLLRSSGALNVLFSLVHLFFGAVLLALYLHPQSREYRRIWFK
ncbi:MAG: hypothetical protein ABSG81_14855 [Acidimicrobiales bacterium]|jgi:hypothetical protein